MIEFIVGLLVEIIVYCLENTVEYMIPLYLTVNIIKNENSSKYQNCLTFWCLFSIIKMMEHLTLFTLNGFLTYRILKILCLSIIQLNNFEMSHNLLIFGSPFIEIHEVSIEKTINKVDFQITELRRKSASKLNAVISKTIENGGTALLSAARLSTELIRDSFSSSDSSSEEPKEGEKKK